MSSHFTCCGCWPTFIRSVQGTARPGRTYRRAKYNEREYSIEFENLIEEEDFYPPSQRIVTDVERDLLSRGKFGELLQHESDIGYQQDAKLKEKEENARLEDEAYIQAKREASRVAKQTMRKKVNDKSDFPNMKKFDSVEFSKWLSEEKIDITSPELDVEDFESFLEKVRAKSAQALEEAGKKKDATAFEQTLTQGLAATKIAGDALNALQPVELHAVGMPIFNENYQHGLNVTEHGKSFDSNSVIPSTTDSSLTQSGSTVIHTPQLPLTYSPMVDPQKKGDRLINISPDTNEKVISEIPAIQSSISSAVQSTNKVSAADTTVIHDISQSNDTSVMSDASELLKTTSSEISQTHALNTTKMEPVIQSHDGEVKNSSDMTLPITPHFFLDNSSKASVTNMPNEKLVDVSPLNDDSQLLAVQLQSKVPQDDPLSFENQAFDEPSILNKTGILHTVEGLPDVSIQPKPIKSLNIISDMQIESESINSDSLVPMTTVVTINTPRNMATNLNPVENNVIHSSTIISNKTEVQPVTPSVNQDSAKDASCNSDDDFYDFDDDDFANTNSNGAFEDYLA